VRTLQSPSRATDDRRAWRAASAGDRTAWTYPLSRATLAAFDRALRDSHREGRPVTDLRVSHELRRACSADLDPVLAGLEAGLGFAVIDRITVERYSVEESQALYWMIGQVLGEPCAQNVQGTLLYDVRDYGKDVSQGARFSVTNAESSFHTDASFMDEVVDYVGLLCLQTARSGGLSQVVSGYSACQELRQKHPGALETLSRPFHIDRRGGVRDGESPTARFPILRWDDGGLTVRYLRYWIEVGHAKASEPLTPEQTRAMDLLDGVLNRPELRAEFHLERGQMFFVNNRWIFHNRTAFEDHPEPEQRRHLVRLWLRARDTHGRRV
jgi:alpha-ketoglutarate-dependent taurine dioxygenase